MDLNIAVNFQRLVSNLKCSLYIHKNTKLYMIHLLQIKIEGSEPHSPYPPDMSMNDDEEIIRVNINIYLYTVCSPI